MSAKKRRLDQLKIVSPCSTDWDQMAGDEKKRFCSECNKFVYDFSQMTRRQVEAMVSIHQGRMCARITRLPDGSLLTLETPPAHPIVDRRASTVVNATLAAILGLSVPANALNAEVSAAQLVVRSDADSDGAKAPYGGGEGLVGGIVLDPQVAAIPNAVVKLISDAGVELKTKTSTEGEFAFARVPFGSYLLLVEAQGFFTHVSSSVIVDTPYDMRFEVTMKVNQPIVLNGSLGDGGPQSLLDLYRHSDLVAIAQVGQSTIAEKGERGRWLKTALRISSQLKGTNSRQVISLYHWVDDNDPIIFKRGDKLLVLLQHSESEEGERPEVYEPTGWGNSNKKLDDGALAIYRQRIEELTAIYQRGAPEPAELVEWLVRCVEDPVTREESVPALSNSLYLLTSQREQENEAKSQSVEGEESSGESGDVDEDSNEQSSDNAEDKWERENIDLAMALTPDHKSRLANVLFGIAELSEADMKLVSLIEDLGEERLAPYLVSQLRRVADDAPRFAVSIIRMIAWIIKDEDLKRLADESQDAATTAIFDRSEARIESDQQDSTRNRRSGGMTVAAIKRSAMIKDFLKLVEFKTKL
jgi:hypothetical protein